MDETETPAPRSAFLGAVGRLDRPEVKMTNAAWRLGLHAIGLDVVRIVNDYVPLAPCLPALDWNSSIVLARIGGDAASTGERLVLVPALLGLAALAGTTAASCTCASRGAGMIRAQCGCLRWIRPNLAARAEWPCRPLSAGAMRQLSRRIDPAQGGRAGGRHN